MLNFDKCDEGVQEILSLYDKDSLPSYPQKMIDRINLCRRQNLSNQENYHCALARQWQAAEVGFYCWPDSLKNLVRYWSGENLVWEKKKQNRWDSPHHYFLSPSGQYQVGSIINDIDFYSYWFFLFKKKQIRLESIEKYHRSLKANFLDRYEEIKDLGLFNYFKIMYDVKNPNRLLLLGFIGMKEKFESNEGDAEIKTGCYYLGKCE